MPIGILFWVIFVVCLLFTGWTTYPFERRSAGVLAVFLLIFLLGWRVFGFVIQN